MTLEISKFVSELNKRGPARSNLFLVEFGNIRGNVKQTNPLGALDPAVKGSFSEKDVMHNELNNHEMLTLFVQQVNIPETKLERHKQHSDRIPYDAPQDMSYGELNITFLCDQSMVHKHYFQEWMTNIINPSTHAHAFYNDYICNIVVKMFDTKGNLRNAVEFTECYPVSIADVDYAAGPSDKFVEFKVGFTYRLQFETQVTKSSFSSSFGAGDIEEGGAGIGEAANEFQSLLAGTGFEGIGNFIGQAGSGINGIASTIGGFARKGGAIVDAVITRPLDKVRGIQSTVGSTINKVQGVGAKGLSGTKDLGNVIPGAKNLLNVLKR